MSVAAIPLPVSRMIVIIIEGCVSRPLLLDECFGEILHRLIVFVLNIWVNRRLIRWDLEIYALQAKLR